MNDKSPDNHFKGSPEFHPGSLALTAMKKDQIPENSPQSGFVDIVDLDDADFFQKLQYRRIPVVFCP